jgi:polyisoprenyl-teichoic acid--peptidoglycan teichoic acid transferase
MSKLANSSGLESHASRHHATRRSSANRGFTLPLWALGVIALVFVGVAVFAGVILFEVVQDFVASGPFAPAVDVPMEPAAIPKENFPDPEDEAPVVVPEEGNDEPAVPAGIRPQERVTILVLGLDQPCETVEEPYRSDTMILVTIDPLSKTAGILSIPRDLWVPIPGFGSNRINTAYRSGEMHEYPGGGPALAMETVEYNLGVHLHHYVTINYDGFIEAVDLIGGIDVDVAEDIRDPDYPDRCYGYDPFYLSEGQHHLDGATALKYARTRATFGVDFDRADRQQDVILAALDQIMGQNLSLLATAPELWTAFEDNVTTSLSYQEATGLALLVMEIPRENIRRAVIDYNYVQDYTAPDNARVLIPIRERIRELRDTFFSAVILPEENLPSQMKSEMAELVVLNGTWTSGLAGSTAEYLETHGLIVASVGDAENKDQPETQIFEYAEKPATVNYVAQLLQVPPRNIFRGDSSDGEHDITIILGADWRLPQE